MEYIKFSSVTHGQKAASVLSRHYISSSLRRNPNPNRKEGCNYALFVSCNLERALKIINESQIPNLGAERFGEEK